MSTETKAGAASKPTPREEAFARSVRGASDVVTGMMATLLGDLQPHRGGKQKHRW
jgi:hypothetical protein